MALFKKMLKKEKKENVLQPAQQQVNSQVPNDNELDLNNVSSMPDENTDSENNLPGLDLPDFDSLLDDDKNDDSKQADSGVSESDVNLNKENKEQTSQNSNIPKNNIENEQRASEEKSVDRSVNHNLPNLDEDISEVPIDDSINVFDGDYFVSLGNYKSICDRLVDFDENVKDLNKISDEFFSLYNGKETILKNSDNSFEEIHRKILLIDGICFKDD